MQLAMVIGEIESDCPDMGSWLSDMHMQGRIRVYDNDFGDWGDIHAPGTMTAEVHIWSGAFYSVGELSNTLRHEAGHHWVGGGTEAQADHFMTNCWN